MKSDERWYIVMELTDYKALPVDQIAQSLFGTPTEGNPRSQWIRWRNTPLGTVSVHRVLRAGEKYQWWTASTLLNPNQGAKNSPDLVLARVISHGSGFGSPSLPGIGHTGGNRPLSAPAPPSVQFDGSQRVCVDCA